jgi:hypothetical protein
LTPGVTPRDAVVAASGRGPAPAEPASAVLAGGGLPALAFGNQPSGKLPSRAIELAARPDRFRKVRRPVLSTGCTVELVFRSRKQEFNGIARLPANAS